MCLIFYFQFTTNSPVNILANENKSVNQRNKHGIVILLCIERVNFLAEIESKLLEEISMNKLEKFIDS